MPIKNTRIILIGYPEDHAEILELAKRSCISFPEHFGFLIGHSIGAQTTSPQQILEEETKNAVNSDLMKLHSLAGTQKFGKTGSLAELLRIGMAESMLSIKSVVNQPKAKANPYAREDNKSRKQRKNPRRDGRRS